MRDLDTPAPSSRGYSISGGERRALAAVAYGRTDSPDDEARAAEARLALHELDLREAAERQALERAARDALVARERRARRIRSRLLGVGGAVAGVALIVAAGAMLLAPPQADAGRLGDLPRYIAPTASASDTPSTPSGGAANAQFWFDEPQTAEDRTPTQLDRIDPDSTRAVGSDVEGWQIWVAKDVDDSLCLIVHETATGINAWSCNTPEQFASSGLLITATGTTPITAYWDGFDLHSEATPPGSASADPGATERGQHAKGNAERWLADPQEASDKLDPAPTGIDAATTRAVDVDLAGWGVWIAKDREGNFCIAVRESGTVEPAVACATPEMFAKAGVEVSAVGATSITAFWDGVIVQTGPNGHSFVPVGS